MSKFEDRVREVVDPIVTDIERMFYDGEQALDLTPINDSLATIKRFLADIKFELDPVNRNELRGNKPDDPKESQEDESPSLSDNIPPQLLEDLRTLSDLYYDAIREKGIPGAKEYIQSLLFNDDGSINPLGFPDIVELFMTTDSADTLGALFEHWGIPKEFANILGKLAAEAAEAFVYKGFNKFGKGARAIKDLAPVSVLGPSNFQIGSKVSEGFTNTMDSIDTAVDTLERSIQDISKYLSDVIKPFVDTIYNKLVECCVKDDIQDMKSELTELKDNGDELNFKISSLQPTTNLNNTLNVVTSNKAIMAKLREIRGLL